MKAIGRVPVKVANFSLISPFLSVSKLNGIVVSKGFRSLLWRKEDLTVIRHVAEGINSVIKSKILAVWVDAPNSGKG